MKVEIFWDIKPCHLVHTYRRLVAAGFLCRWEPWLCWHCKVSLGALPYKQLQPETLGFTNGHRPVCLFCTTTVASLLVGTNEQMLGVTPPPPFLNFYFASNNGINWVTFFKKMCVYERKFMTILYIWLLSKIKYTFTAISHYLCNCALKIDFNIILSFTLRFSICLLSSVFGTNVCRIFSLFLECYMSHLSHHP
jgi:hypothetical protein